MRQLSDIAHDQKTNMKYPCKIVLHEEVFLKYYLHTTQDLAVSEDVTVLRVILFEYLFYMYNGLVYLRKVKS